MKKPYVPRKKPSDKPPVRLEGDKFVIEIRDEVNDDWIKVLQNEHGNTDLKAHEEIARRAEQSENEQG